MSCVPMKSTQFVGVYQFSSLTANGCWDMYLGTHLTFSIISHLSPWSNSASTIKKMLGYDTIGIYIMYMGVHELTVIIGVVMVVVEVTGAEFGDLIRQIIVNDKRLADLRDYTMTA